jgi:hypothetical protein
MSENVQDCPHCGVPLKKWLAPPESSWGTTVQLVCFNDECPYYVRGWKHMMENYEQKASYRYRYNPENGDYGPLPVWSPNALREGIIEDEEEE